MSIPPDDNPGRRASDAPGPILIFLKRTIFEPLQINGATLWRRGNWVGTWDEAPCAFLDQAAAERAALEKENAKLRDVSHPILNQIFEFLYHYSGMAIIGVVAYQGEILKIADDLGPGWSKVASVVVSVAVFWAGQKYLTKKNAERTAETVAKEMVVGQDRRQGETK